jgi:putative endonuclease
MRSRPGVDAGLISLNSSLPGEGLAESFTKRYGVKTLVYFEQHATIEAALQREKNIKHWSREWKVDLIVASNTDWRDLHDEIVR